MKIVTLTLAAFMFFIAPPVQAAELSGAQKTEIEALIKDYLLNNPDVLIESLENHRTAQEEKAAKAAQEAAQNLTGSLDESNLPWAGSETPDLTIVEFMDYNCGYCKKAFEEVQSVLKSDDKIRVYFVEMPILGPTSVEAAKWALAAHRQDKYFEFHAELMKHQGPKNDAVLKDKAERAGLDIKQLKKDIEDPAILSMLEENMARAEALAITGTPGFIIGDEVVRGYMTLDQLKELIKMQRAS